MHAPNLPAKFTQSGNVSILSLAFSHDFKRQDLSPVILLLKKGRLTIRVLAPFITRKGLTTRRIGSKKPSGYSYTQKRVI